MSSRAALAAAGAGPEAEAEVSVKPKPKPKPLPLPPPRESPRVAKIKALAKQVEAAENEKKQQIAAEGLVKLLELPGRPVNEKVPVMDDLSVLTPAERGTYVDRLAALTKSWETFKSTRRLQETSRDAINELFMIDTTPLALLMFGPQRVALWETKYGGSPRDIFEIAEINDQCLATIGDIIHPSENDYKKVGKPGATIEATSCWICGMPIWFPKSELPDGDKNGHSPECEHILPIAQAALFLQLYDKSNTPSGDVYPLEYAWSHKTCNQTKNDDVFYEYERKTKNKAEKVIINPKTNLPEIDEIAYVNLLEKIYASKRSDAVRDKAPGFKKHVQKNIFELDRYSFRDTLQDWINFAYPGRESVKAWKEDRLAVLKQKYTAIFTFIGRRNYEMSPELYILSLASATAAIINRQDENRRVKKGEQSVRREVLFGRQPASNAAAAPASASNAAAAPAFAPPPPPAAEPAAEPAAAPEVDVLDGPFGPLSADHMRELLRPMSVLEMLPKDGLFMVQIPHKSQPVNSPSVGDKTRQLASLAENKQVGVTGLQAAAAPPGKRRETLPELAHAQEGDPPALVKLQPPRDASTREHVEPKRTDSSLNPMVKKGGRRTRRRTSSFLPHKRRRTYHAAIKMSSRRHSLTGKASRR